MPAAKWQLRAPPPAFDFLTFDESTRLVDAAGGIWRTMILVAMRTGLRHGALLALRWQDIDLAQPRQPDGNTGGRGLESGVFPGELGFRRRDSNPNMRNQNPLSCHWTTPEYRRAAYGSSTQTQPGEQVAVNGSC